MVDLPTGSRKRERSLTLTIAGHSTILNHCHQMLRSLSNRSCKRTNNELNATNNESATSIQRRKSMPRNLFGNRQSIKKAFSLIFHRVDSAPCHPPDDNEMHEFIRRTSSEENLNTTPRSLSTISNKSILHQSALLPHATCPTTVHHKFFAWKNKFRCRHEHPDNNHEKNNGYLVVLNPDTDPAFLPDENIDHQQTQHAQPCVQINELGFDLNQIQYSSVTPLTPNLSPPKETSLMSYIPHYNLRLHHDLDVQSTRSSVECGVPQSDFVNIHDIQMSQMVSITSSSSTNSSCHEYTGIDRSMLDDSEYVRAQELDLHRLIDVEIDLYKECASLEQDLEDEEEFNHDYDTVLKQNLDLKEKLKTLEEEHERIYSSWSCELCTFINQPYIATQRDICDMCEGPSPLKRATLTK